MTRRRWIADEVSGDKAALVGDHADHLVRVLRARIGQEFDISTAAGVRRGRVTSLNNQRVELELGEEVPGAILLEITLLLSIFKFDPMEWAIEKCTELGVSHFVPVIARRTDSHLAVASAKRAERWRRIALQASEQSRRPSPPEIADPVKLPAALNTTAGFRIVLAENERRTMLHDVVERAAVSSSIVLAIGPEGGWTDSELQAFQKAGWISASLGQTILRAETAAIAATAIAGAALTRL
ncbi:MAG TPA: RsmE family RNA methyltransferase [Candidatus Sulfotelmatobacter sp.]|jgi:16S rRNA (uracil1498-N3)-methyltransferase